MLHCHHQTEPAGHCPILNAIPHSEYCKTECSAYKPITKIDKLITHTTKQIKEIIPKPKEYSLRSMAKSFFTVGYKHVTTGMKERIVEQRIEIHTICRLCEHYMFDTRINKERCGKCGCFLGPKIKWAVSNCPLGKWKEIDDKYKDTDNDE